MVEENWTQEQTLSELVEKSGFKSKLNKAIKDSIILTTYQSQVNTLSYQEYLKK